MLVHGCRFIAHSKLCQLALASRMWIKLKSCRKYASCSNKLNVVFYGTDQFSVESLKRLHENLLLDEDSPLKVIKNLDIISGVNTMLIKAIR